MEIPIEHYLINSIPNCLRHHVVPPLDCHTHTHTHTHTRSDIEKIQSGIGDKLALFIQYITTFLAGFVIAFAINWKMALVVSVMLPLLTVMAFMIAKVGLCIVLSTVDVLHVGPALYQ